MNDPDIGERITFQTFCTTCESIKSAKGAKKSEILSKYFEECRIVKDANLYPVVRLFVPQAERERGSYGIKETTFAKLFIRVMNLPIKGIDATKLLNYKAPSSSANSATDFADVAYWVLKSRSRANNKNLTISDVNKHLDTIAACYGNNMTRSIDEELTKLINGLPVVELKWLIRIVLKDLKLGMGQQRILTVFHSDAQDLYDSTNNLLKVCTVLKNPDVNLHEIEIEMFSPFRPMLSERLDITKINNVMKHRSNFLIETKFDGERFQIHMKDGEFRFFSRNGFDYTEHYGKSYEIGPYTRRLRGAFNADVQNFIIDGEMMGWHKLNKTFSSKGINFDVKKITEHSVFQPCFCAFDILLYNDLILTNKPLNVRLSHLSKLFNDKEGVIMHSVTKNASESDVVLNALNQAIEQQEEGIVMKIVDSVYKPNNRKAGWYKIKPEYTEGVMNELDLLIIGGYYAENKQYGSIGSILLGVVELFDEHKHPTMLHSCGRVKLTLQREEFIEICNKLQTHWKVVDKDNMPPSLSWTKDKPHVWIEPKHSVIVQVKATELIRTTEYKTDYTLRFPRVVKVRYDKPWYDCLTLKEFNDLTKHSGGVEKLTSRNITSGDLEQSTDTSPRKRGALRLGSQFVPTNLSNVQEKSTIFGGKEFCVMSGNSQITKSELEVKIHENGGSVVQNPGANTFCIIAGDLNLKIKNAIKFGQHNVATIDWLLNSLKIEFIESGSLLEWTPKDLLGTSKQIAEEFAYKFDDFGDSYTKPATIESLKYSMEQVGQLKAPIHVTTVELMAVDDLLFGGTNPHSFMRPCRLYFVDSEDVYEFTSMQKIQLQLLKTELQFYGATCSDTIDDATHIIVLCTSDSDGIENLRRRTKQIVAVDWLYECLRNKELTNLDNYLL